jgi:hypothetical protein
MPTKDHLKKLIFNHNRRLQKLKEQHALEGPGVDPKILIQIEDIEAEIENLQAALEELDERAEESSESPPLKFSDLEEPQTANTGGSAFHIDIGDKAQNVVIGENITNVHQAISQPPRAQVTESDLATIRNLFKELQSQVAAETPPDKKNAALERVEELQEAIIAEEPDLETMAYLKKWFGKNVPHLIKAIIGVLCNPMVGKVVEARGGPTAAELKQRFGQE